jgi:hypothetical protein
VGDPVQLPATVISTIASDHNYEQSMFKRLMVGGACVICVRCICDVAGKYFLEVLMRLTRLTRRPAVAPANRPVTNRPIQ